MLINNSRDFDFLEIGLAAPDRIRFWSYGEIEKPETINYRTFKPERKGLFCEKIFGPVKDWECSCGKYRRVRYRGVVCERCGVEVTHSKVRRERMGHIELATPVTHIWFLKGIPSYIGLLLDMSSRYLEEIVYYDSYVVTEVSPELEDILPVKKLLSTVEYIDLKEKYKDKFKADIGASAIKSLLAQMDIKKLITESYQLLDELKGQKRLKVTKRLRVLEGLFKSGNRPEWMILDVIPVMPPDLRPMVQLEGGRFATSDLNDLYRRIVNRNNRLKRLMDINAPEMIIRNEKRMLQEAVDVLISNGKRGRAVTGSNGRPLKSLGNIIEGKQGRFRQNLLGKRVDYSARSVIVVGPHLKFYQCGLPKEMALELFKPFVIRKLVEDGIVSNVKSAKKKIEKKEIAVWDALEKVIKGQCVLLNRAPTLHRLGIQAFEPILVEGSAIQIHPLVCTAFNADFDGDQMAVHVPLGFEAQTEARLLIMSSNNILSPSSGRPIVTPTQDMTLGCYFLTIDNPDSEHGKGKTYKDIYDAIISWENKAVGIQSEIVVKIQNQKIKTTIGRILFNKEIWDVLKSFELPESSYINHKVGKSELADMVYRWYITYGNDVTSELIDRLKNIGFKYSTLSGISISIDDLTIPKNKAFLLENAQKEIEKLEKLEKSGAIGSNEKKLRSNDVWRGTTQQVSDALEKEMGRLNNIYIMAHSGARGNIDQVRQLAGMRGLMSDSQGRTVDIPIRSNFKEGLNVTEYFISTYGARKGLVDTALRTADSGYLTRRLVDVAQDVIITTDDCGTKEGIELTAIRDGINIVVPFSEMIEGRVSLEMVKHPKTSEVIIKENECISREHAKLISQAGIESLKVRSVYHCKAERGICQKCYGIDLASAKLINIGEAVGIIAAQSIGEPGTQLTMRTFHTGGVDLRKAAKVDIKANISGKVSIPKDALFTKINKNGSSIWISTQDNYISILGDTTQYQLLPKGTSLLVKEDQKVNIGTILAEYDPSFEYIVAQESGTLKLLNAELQESKDEKGNITHTYSQKDGEIFVYNPSNIKEIEVSASILEKCKINCLASAKLINNPDIVSSVLVLDIGKKQEEKVKKKSLSTVKLKVVSGEVYSFLRGAEIYVVDGDKLNKGDVIARERIDDLLANKTQDIVQGLPRVEELFEARKIKDSAILSEIDGVIDVEQSEYYRLLYVTSKDGFQKEYKIPLDSRLKVFSGQNIKKGDQLNEGGINPHDVLETIGVVETQRFLSEEIQKVYRSQGVQINSKHIEVIVRQMTRKVIIMDMGDTTFLLNELIDIRILNKVNEEIIKQGKKPAIGKYVLLGITRASLNTESFVSASSFQQTASVLTQAAVTGKVDQMKGLKESVIIGKRIPAGTGFIKYDHLKLILSDDFELNAQESDNKIILNK